MPRRATHGRDGRHPRQAPAPTPAKARALVAAAQDRARSRSQRYGADTPNLPMSGPAIALLLAAVAM